MKLRRIYIAVLITLAQINIASVNAMTKGMVYVKPEGYMFANALHDGDVETMKYALSENRNLATTKVKSPLHNFTEVTPIEIALANKYPANTRYEIINLLLANGASKDAFNDQLLIAVKQEDVNEINWLVGQGAKNDSALAFAKQARAGLHPRRDKESAATFDNIISILEKNK